MGRGQPAAPTSAPLKPVWGQGSRTPGKGEAELCSTRRTCHVASAGTQGWGEAARSWGLGVEPGRGALGPSPAKSREERGGASPPPWPPRAPGTWETGQGGIGPGTPRPPRPPHADPASPGSKATLRHDRGRFLRLRVATRVPSLWSHRPGEACPGRRRPGDPTLPAPALRGPRATEKPATVFILK